MAVASIVLTGANGHVGRSTLAALTQMGVPVTALIREGQPLVGCPTIENWPVSEEAVTAISRAEAVVHLAGTLSPPDHDFVRANVVTTERVAGALQRTQTGRIVFLSYVGASESSPNLYLHTKARAERLLEETGIPVTVFRCTHIIGTPEDPGPTAGPMLLDGRKSVPVLGSGKQRVAPVFVGDVVAAILAALSSEKSGVFDLQGPEEMTLDDLVRLLNEPEEVGIKHMPGPIARLLRFFGPKLPGALIDVMLRDCISDTPTAQDAFNLSLTALSGIWGRNPSIV